MIELMQSRLVGHREREKCMELEQKYDLGPYAVDVGPGWFPLVEEMLAEVYNTVRRDQLEVKTIRQKLGKAQIAYMNGWQLDKPDKTQAQRDAHKIINSFKERLTKICEECGSKAHTRYDTSGWISILCDECFEAKEREFRET